MLDEVTPCFVAVATAIATHQPLLVVCHNRATVATLLSHLPQHNLHLVELPSNDTWARDHSAISVFDNHQPAILDFAFNGWGLKFPANLDNLLTSSLYQKKIFAPEVGYHNLLDTVLEGGGIESDGCGTILTTEACQLSPNRNGFTTRTQAEEMLRHTLGAQRILWLTHGWLAGDDTDSHIDTLARFCSPDTIAYVKCTDPADEHYTTLNAMEQELKALRTPTNTPYALIPLPMAPPCFDPDDNHRLPATYANFLITNHSILLPTYNSPLDTKAAHILATTFPTREVIPINSLPLIRQHGSLHCITMQYPAGFLNTQSH